MPFWSLNIMGSFVFSYAVDKQTDKQTNKQTEPNMLPTQECPSASRYWRRSHWQASLSRAATSQGPPSASCACHTQAFVASSLECLCFSSVANEHRLKASLAISGSTKTRVCMAYIDWTDRWWSRVRNDGLKQRRIECTRSSTDR